MNAIDKVCHESMKPSSATLANRMCFGNCHINISRVHVYLARLSATRNTLFARNGLFRSFLRGTGGLLTKIHGADDEPISQSDIFEAEMDTSLFHLDLLRHSRS